MVQDKVVKDALLIKVLEDTLKNLKAETRGDLVSNIGVHTHPLGAIEVTLVERVSFDGDALLTLLRDRGIEPEAVGTLTFKPNEEALQTLIAAGILDGEEVQQTSHVKSHHRVVVKPTQEAKALIGTDANHSVNISALLTDM